MKKLCLIGSGQPSRNPRLVRDANILAATGYDVVVITPQIVQRTIFYDAEITKEAKWKYISIDIFHSRYKRIYWNYVRLRHFVSKFFSKWLSDENIIGNSCDYFNIELSKMAAEVNADLYVAYQQVTLPAAVWAAKKTRSQFAVDIHDLLSDSPSEPVHIMRNIEERYLSKCVYVSTMSSVAAERIQKLYALSAQPIVLHNTPGLLERSSILPPEQRSTSKIISIYWFGQTIGYHSRADQVIRAMPLLEKPIKLVLRGHPDAVFVNKIIALAQELGVSDCLEILPVAAPQDMVKLAADHDILLGSQPGEDLFHQMAIGNKVFTGMMAGLALALTDTIAYRSLLTEFPNCGFLFPDKNEVELAKKINELIQHPEILQSMKISCWHLAESHFNWEQESKKLINRLAEKSSISY
jgi:glycosyltransferase involved in cell wall biosynthesis